MELRKLEKFRPIILDIETTFPKAFKIVKKNTFRHTSFLALGNTHNQQKFFHLLIRKIAFHVENHILRIYELFILQVIVVKHVSY